MSKPFEKIRGFFARYRKRGAIVLAILITLELASAGAVAFAGREWINEALASAPSDGGRVPGLGLNGSLHAPSIAAF